MSFPAITKPRALIYLALCTLPYCISYITGRFLRRRSECYEREVQNCNVEYFFVTNKNRICTTHVNDRKSCGASCSYKYIEYIIKRIEGAKHSVSLCMYHLTMEDIFKAILKIAKQGVQVRCITDRVMLNCTGSKMQRLQEQGVQVKAQTIKQSIMHHKFLLIDEKSEEHRRVLFGSLNYTLQGFLNNWENFIDTDEERIIRSFTDEFDHLWNVLEFLK